MRFLNASGELDDRGFERTYGAEAGMVLSGLDCALECLRTDNGPGACYGSSPLTTGPRFYRLLAETGARNREELRERLGDEGWNRQLWEPNTREADEFARRLATQLGTVIVTPAPFVAAGWTQPEYLAFWETIIRTRLKAVYFNRGWEFSNGCVFELSVALDAGLPTFDFDRRTLSLQAGVERVHQAVETIRSKGLEPVGLEENLHRLEKS